MNEQEMQARSREKVKQVMDLAKMLHLGCEARQRVNPQSGFIEQVVFWTDNEKYPAAEPAPASTGEAKTETEAPKEELGPGVQEMVLPAEEAPEEHAG